MERLDKLIANTGEYSRSEAKKLIKDGSVCINGRVANKPEEKCDESKDEISIFGRILSLQTFTYVMLHKPAGILTATEDKKCETVLDLLPDFLQKRDLSPVGRLDKDTEGLLLITNDGQLNHRLLAPKSHVDKVYYVQTDGEVTEEDIQALERGLLLGDGLQCLPAKCEKVSENEVLLTIQEGKFHQVKRMMACLGKPVHYLKRLSMGPLTLDASLAKGEWRYLTENEIHALMQK